MLFTRQLIWKCYLIAWLPSYRLTSSRVAKIWLVIFYFYIIWMLNWCMWIWKWVIWREVLKSYCGQKSLLACTKSTFPKYVLGRAELSDVVQASDLPNEALLPQVSRLQMAIKPGVKLCLHSLMGTFKQPSNFSMAPMRAFRKKTAVPQSLCSLWPFLVWQHQLEGSWQMCPGWHFGCTCAWDGCSCHRPHAPAVTAHAGKLQHRNRRAG